MLYNKVPVNQSEITAVRTVLLEQLHSLNERFKNLRSDDACEETDTKHNDVEATSKLTSVLQDISELVYKTKISLQYLVLYFILFF